MLIISKDVSKKEIHYRYGICFLVLLIVWIVTEKYTGNDDFVDKVNFASTIASLILAIVAIIYSMIEGAKGAESLGKIKEAAEVTLNSARLTENSLNEIKALTKEHGISIEAVSQKVEFYSTIFGQNKNQGTVAHNRDNSNDVITMFAKNLYSQEVLAQVLLFKILVVSFQKGKTVLPLRIGKILGNEQLGSGYVHAMIHSLKAIGAIKTDGSTPSMKIEWLDSKVIELYEKFHTNALLKILKEQDGEGHFKMVDAEIEAYLQAA